MDRMYVTEVVVSTDEGMDTYVQSAATNTPMDVGVAVAQSVYEKVAPAVLDGALRAMKDPTILDLQAQIDRLSPKKVNKRRRLENQLTAQYRGIAFGSAVRMLQDVEILEVNVEEL